jgi:hypothetical protein
MITDGRTRPMWTPGSTETPAQPALNRLRNSPDHRPRVVYSLIGPGVAVNSTGVGVSARLSIDHRRYLQDDEKRVAS